MDEKKLLRIIEKAAKDGKTKLDLFEMGIKSLPAQIGQLTELITLDLRRKQLNSIPAEIG